MANPLREIAKAAAAIERTTLNREAAMAMAFQVLHEHRPVLVQFSIEYFGDRRRAARWMCLHQQAFEGKSAYDILASGADDRVWGALLHSGGGEYRCT